MFSIKVMEMVADLIQIVVSAFLIGFFASTAATGPVNFLVFHNALIGKYYNSIMMILGSTIIETIYCSFALTVVGAILFSYKGVQFFSEIIGIIILFFAGILLFRADPNKKLAIGVERLSVKEKTRSFLTGFILVALNPTVVLTWSAAITALISFKIIEIIGILDILAFTLSAGIGTLSGSLTMVFLINIYRLDLSKKFIESVLKIMALVVWGLALYFLLLILGVF